MDGGWRLTGLRVAIGVVIATSVTVTQDQAVGVDVFEALLSTMLVVRLLGWATGATRRPA